MGVGVTVMRPTTCGVLQKLHSASFPEIDRDRVTELAINFALSSPEVDCVVVGMRSADEVRGNVMLEADTSRRVDLRRLHNRFDPLI
jgi:predicted aldo/keto reductase-like oxidoreductase